MDPTIMKQLMTVNIIMVFLFITLGIIHIIILVNLVHRSRRELSSGHLKDFTGSILVTISIGFLFFLWSMLTKLEIINIRNVTIDIVITNIIAVSFLMSLTHLAYSAKDFSKNFGFSRVGEKVTRLAKKKK